MVADLDVLGVEPQVRVGALQRPAAEQFDLLIQAAAQRRDAVLGHPLDPQLLHQPVDLPGRTPLTYASSTTATIACSDRRRGSKNDGK